MSALLTLIVATTLGPARASDILMPTFTPKTTSDFGPAETLTEDTLAALNEQGVAFVPPSEIVRRTGAIAEGCAEEPECVPALWRSFPPARLVVVGDVTRAEGMLTAKVRFYAPEDPSPVEVLSDTFPEHQSPAFAEQVAFFAMELVKLVPERAAVGVPVAAEPPIGDVDDDPDPPDPPELAVEPEPEPPKPRAVNVTEYYPPLDSATSQAETGRREPPLDDDEDRRKTGLPPVAWDRYKASGLPYDEWKDKAFVRTGKVVLELWGGFSFGDVDRVYDTRVAIDQTGDVEDPAYEQTAAYQYEAFVRGDAFSVGAGLGYHPAWWVEFGVSGSVLFASKSLSTGWEHYHEGSLVAAESESFDPVDAQMAMIEPRLRIYFVATGPIKPYVLGGGNIRIFDAYVVPDLADVDYPDREGGVGFGVTGGGGVAFDVPGGAIALIEVPWTALLSPEPWVSGGEGLQDVPTQLTGARQMLTFRAGFGVRL